MSNSSKLLSYTAGIVFSLPLVSTHAETLGEVYLKALENDHTYKAAEATYKAGKESKNIGRAGLLPNVTASATWSESENERSGVNLSQNINGPLTPGPVDESGDTTTNGVTLTVTQPLFDMSLWHNYKSGKASASAAESLFRSEQQTLIIRAAEAYFAALQAVDNLSTAKAEENALQHSLEQTKQRFEVGLTAITEVHEAQAVFDSAVAERLNAQGQLGIAFEGLEVITGESFESLVPIKEGFPVTMPQPLNRDEWVEMALEKNESLRRAAFQTNSSKHAAKSARSGHLPTVTGQFRYSKDNTETNATSFDGFPQEGNIDNENTAISVTLSVPLFAGGRTSASSRQAKQQYIQTRESGKQLKRDIIQNIRSFHLNVTTGVATVKARKQAITSSQSALEATQAGYEVGTRDLVDVLNSQRNLYRAQRNYLDTLYDYILNSLRLKLVAGVLTTDDLNELSVWLDVDNPVSRY